MQPRDQVRHLSHSDSIEFFGNKLHQSSQFPLQPSPLDIFQINVGKLCNMTCSHCHVEAGPDKIEENMTRDTFEMCLEKIKESGASTIDLTGGAPEMNPHLEWFIKKLAPLNKTIIVRSNLTILRVPKYAKFIDIFAENNVCVGASIPCYTEETTDK